MLKNHLRTALRYALRYKGYTALNLLGLIVGLASSILILLWIQDEVDKDKFHAKAERIYQVWRNMHQGNSEVVTSAAIPQPLELTLENEYPEVDEVTLMSGDFPLLFKKGEEISMESGRFVSPEFLSIFSFPLIVGNPGTALNDPNGVVISENMALKYFGPGWRHEVLDQTINIDGSNVFSITGVFQDPGGKSSIQFDWLLPAQLFISQSDWVESWFNGSFQIFFTLNEGANLSAVQQRVEQEINIHTDYAADERIYLQKFTDTYLYSTFENGLPVDGRIQYVKIMFIAAIFVLVIACVNFMNLATARSGRRAKEIGMRKVLGAQKGSLSIQFFTESFLLTIVSVVMALICVKLLMPFFNDITGKSLALNFTDLKFWIGIIGITLVTGLLSGSYPAILLPSLRIISSLKGAVKHSPAGIFFRNSLVIFQFSLSVLLIIGTLVITQQINFILNKNLGLNKENLVFVDLSGDLREKSNLYKNELLNIPEVSDVTIVSGNPLNYGRSTGSAQWEGKDPDFEVEMNVINADADFVETMGMEVINGRAFSSQLASDSVNYMINEVTAGILGFTDPIGKDFSVWGISGKIVGVVKNFHMSSMYEPIAPLVIRYDPENSSIAFIRTQHDVQAALKGIEQVTRDLNPNFPFQYNFLDQTYAEAYQNEITLSTIVNIFAMVSVFIACLGLLGLSSYSAEQRSREISIRKIYGASVNHLLLMLCRKYAFLMLIAFLIAAPLGYYYMQQWLNGFVFRIDLNMILFFMAGFIAFLIGILTVSIKSYQAAAVNPLKKLKEE